MTDASKPPNRRRSRRKLTVAFVVLVSLVVAWWEWPRGDARFVGTWELRDGSLGNPVQLLALQSNGLATIVERGVSVTLWFRWRVDQGDLVLGDGGTGSVVDAIQRLSEVVGGVTSHLFVYGDEEDRFTVLSIANEEITLRRPDSIDKLVLKRIPE